MYVQMEINVEMKCVYYVNERKLKGLKYYILRSILLSSNK